jgi:TolB protein
MIVGCLRSIVFITLGFFLMGPMLCLAQSDADQYEYIDISNPFLRKIPLAVPFFKNVTGTGEEERLSKSSAELLSSSLAFTGYFKILERGAFLFDPTRDGVLSPQINFANWTVIGAELLITGLFEVSNGRIAVELRLFDTFKNKRILGKKYAGRLADREVIQYLTGHQGMFASKIAFVSTGSGNKEIYSSEFDGYSPQQLTRNHSISLFPAWSSDGRYLAYTSYKGGNPDLFIKNLAEMQEVSVAKNGINITPAWGREIPRYTSRIWSPEKLDD